MAELNFNKGQRLAIVENSKIKGENGTEIFLYHPDHKCCLDCSDKCKKSKKCCGECAIQTYHNKIQSGKDDISIDKIKKLMLIFGNKSIEFTEEELDSVLDAELSDGLHGPNIGKNKIVLNSGNFQIAPSNIYGKPDRIYFSGMAGSGKTFALAQYVQQFKKYYPKYRIYLISQKPNDKLLDKLIHKRIPLDQLIEANFEAEDFAESLFIADDIDTISDKKIEKATFDLITKVLEIGRSLNTFMCLTMHLAANHNQTKRILNGCTHYVYFNQGSTRGTEYALQNYFGFAKDEINKLRKLNSRSVCIVRSVPQLVIANNLICFQNTL